MKRLLSLLFVVFACACAFVSCKEDDEPAFSLVGKTYGAKMGGYNDLYDTYEFITTGQVEITTRRGGPSGELYTKPYVGTYELNYPNITIYDKFDVVIHGVFVTDSHLRTGPNQGGRTFDFYLL